ncbi:MAG: DUF4271 domain-containing protein [Bacteroidales bacterium]|nr:DUF4271 domain-containing protein [Bacteroidales bacterium]
MPVCSPLLAPAQSEPAPFTACRDSFFVPGVVQQTAIQPLPKDTLGRIVYRPLDLHTVALPEYAGVNGNPIPVTLRTDDGIVSAIVVCFVMAMALLARSRYYLSRSFKSFLGYSLSAREKAERTNIDTFGVMALVLMAGFSLSLMLVNHFGHSPVITRWAWPVTALLAAATGLYLLLVLIKMGVYGLVNSVLFSRAQRSEWTDSYLLSLALQGLALFPVALLVVFFDLEGESAIWAFFCAFGITKLLLLCRCYRTFFAADGGLVHLFLYFCTLEIVPALFVWRVLFCVTLAPSL